MESTSFVADPELLKSLETIISKAAAPQPGSVLFCQGKMPHGLFIVRKGQAELAMKSGDETVLHMRVAAGSLLGLPAVIGSQPYTLTATALPGSEVSFVSREDFANLLKTSPQLMIKVVELLAAEVRSARQALSGL